MNKKNLFSPYSDNKKAAAYLLRGFAAAIQKQMLISLRNIQAIYQQ